MKKALTSVGAFFGQVCSIYNMEYGYDTTIFTDSRGRIFAGDNVYATSFEMAQAILDSTGRSYMKVDGKLVAEINITDDELKKIQKNLKI